MAHSTTGGTNDFKNTIIVEFQAHEGRGSGQLAGTPMILIHQLSAKSGIEHVTLLAYTRSETAAT
jgi:hypothetical protein